MNYLTYLNLFYYWLIFYHFCCRAIWLNVLGIGSLLLICAYGGLVTFAYYSQKACDPITIKMVVIN